MKCLSPLLLCLMLLASPAAEAQRSPIIYSKSTLTILPAAPTPETPTKKEAKPDVKPPAPRTSHPFTVEIRSPDILRQRDFIGYAALTEKTGMLFVVEPAKPVTLTASNMLAPVDVVFIAPDGKVAAIAPNIALAPLEEPLHSPGDVRAFLFLKAGLTAADAVQPGDTVKHSLFKPHPMLLQ